MSRQFAVFVIAICLTQAMSSLGNAAAQPVSVAPASNIALPQNAVDVFNRARNVGFAAAGQTKPYILHAQFTSRAGSGAVTTGEYTDTFADAKHWRREAVLGQSRFIRSRNGKKWYRMDDGADAALLQFVLTALEPLPDTDGRMGEWKTRPEVVDGVTTTLVWRGVHDEAKVPGPKDFGGFWFDANGRLIKAFISGMEIRRGDFQDFNGVAIARRTEVVIGGKVGMKINVTDVHALDTIDAKMFTMKGQDWRREYTDEVR